jgi:uroporphyrinogen-III synthase
VRVLVTRTADRCEATARKLVAFGHEAVSLPLSRHVDTNEPFPPGRHDAIAFTSAAAVEAIARRIETAAAERYLLSLPAWCVGEATAIAAAKHGFLDARSGGRDGAMLARMIAAGHSAGSRSRILLPTQENVAFDIAAALPGLETAAMIAYKVVEIDPGRDLLQAALASSDAAFTYSPASAGNLLAVSERHHLLEQLVRLTLIAISEKTAAVLRKLGRAEIKVAQSPEEDAMIRLLDR